MPIHAARDADTPAAFEAVTSMVARVIAAHPDRVAVESPQGLLTYAELDARADDVAVTLQRSGARPGAPVPVLAPDRRELVVALLGVLRCGGVVVPLDPAAATEVLRAAIVAVAPEHVLLGAGADGDRPLAAALDAAVPQAVRLHVGDTRGASGQRGPVPHRARPDDPCTVFSTSGSTGAPKGILGRLGSLDHYVRWEAGLLGAAPGWRFSQLTSPAFDAVLRDLFVPLTTGGTVCVPAPEVLLDPAALRRWIDREGIAVVHTVPSVFRRLLDAPAGGPEEFPRLRCVALSGERLPPDDAGRFLDAFGDRVTLLNLYGPTETTMTKTFHVVTRADAGRASVPIGRPMPGAEVLLVDDRGRPAGPGAVGEIHLRTAHRSLGYHRDPAATAGAFVPDPEVPGGVVYRTGDFGRLGADGLLEYLGRADHQVKVGGVRVELDGVAAVLRGHPDVRDAVAVLAGDGTQVRAYVEPTPGAVPDAAALRDHTADRLPAAAVPAGVVVLPALPRTLSGKVDRRALPVDAPAPAADGTPPRTPTERAVAGIWADLLPAAGTDVHRGFFDAGGTSLLVIELLARLSGELGAAVPLGEFLSGPTVAELAVVVERVLLDDAGGTDELDLTGEDAA